MTGLSSGSKNQFGSVSCLISSSPPTFFYQPSCLSQQTTAQRIPIPEARRSKKQNRVKKGPKRMSNFKLQGRLSGKFQTSKNTGRCMTLPHVRYFQRGKSFDSLTACSCPLLCWKTLLHKARNHGPRASRDHCCQTPRRHLVTKHDKTWWS